VSTLDKASAADLGPIDVAVVAFPGNQFKGEIAPAIKDLVDSGTVRIIDLVFITKDSDGNVAGVELSELESDVAQPYDEIEGEIGELLTEDDFEAAGEALEPNSSALMLVWENTWARRVASALRNAGGELVMHERIPFDVVAAAIDATKEG
jgi:uncharacterized membrane protein